MANDWNKIWQERDKDVLRTDFWLRRVLPLLPSGRVLDVACGRGRNALFLAEQGFAVTAVDASAEALAQLASEAERRRLRIRMLQQDLEQHPHLALNPFDVVIQFFYLQRSLLAELRRLVRPGGVAVVRTFSRAGNFPGGPANPAFSLDPGELPTLFAGWQILLHEEGLDQAHRGGGLAGIVARRPMAEGG
jgi:2-polyprenyl-3-methyl-5-hydroxy-6-metoxy-1,4-benzoquinol methylase